MIAYLNDTGLLWNFAVTGRLDILERMFSASRHDAERVLVFTEDGAFRKWCDRTKDAGTDENLFTSGRVWHAMVTRNILQLASNQGWIDDRERKTLLHSLVNEHHRSPLPA